MKQTVRIISVILPCVAIILVVVQVIISNELATLGSRVGKLDTEVAQAQDVHETLEMEVASASSLLSLRERAALFGFHEPEKSQIVALTPEVPVAFGVATDHTTHAPLP
jgi:hypothetical protein